MKTKSSLTKQDEIVILTNAIQDLGENSYLAGWLKSVKDEVENLIRCDIDPTMSYRESIDAAKREAAAIIEQAKSSAEVIVSRAQQIEVEAFNKAARVRDNLASAIRQAERAIE